MKVESDEVTVTGHIKDLCAPLFKDNSRNPWRPDKVGDHVISRQRSACLLFKDNSCNP